MSRPGPWSIAWNEFWASFSRGPTKHYVGEDQFGNRYYQMSRPKRASNVTRGYDPAPGAPTPPVEWLSWAQNARRFPPTEEEIRLGIERQKAQSHEDARTERMAPKIDSRGLGAADMDRKQQAGFPSYQDDFELNPGAKKQGEWEKDGGRDDDPRNRRQ